MTPIQRCVAVASFIAVIFGLWPLFWLFGKWHCYWFAAAPVCQSKDGGSPVMPSKDFRLADFKRAANAIGLR